jgi:hypothetical protein
VSEVSPSVVVVPFCKLKRSMLALGVANVVQPCDSASSSDAVASASASSTSGAPRLDTHDEDVYALQ